MYYFYFKECFHFTDSFLFFFFFSYSEKNPCCENLGEQEMGIFISNLKINKTIKFLKIWCKILNYKEICESLGNDKVIQELHFQKY